MLENERVSEQTASPSGPRRHRIRDCQVCTMVSDHHNAGTIVYHTSTQNKSYLHVRVTFSSLAIVCPQVEEHHLLGRIQVLLYSMRRVVHLFCLLDV